MPRLSEEQRAVLRSDLKAAVKEGRILGDVLSSVAQKYGISVSAARWHTVQAGLVRPRRRRAKSRKPSRPAVNHRPGSRTRRVGRVPRLVNVARSLNEQELRNAIKIRRLWTRLERARKVEEATRKQFAKATRRVRKLDRAIARAVR